MTKDEELEEEEDEDAKSKGKSILQQKLSPTAASTCVLAIAKYLTLCLLKYRYIVTTPPTWHFCLGKL